MTARGEMSLEQLSADTLKVILSGHWKLGGDLPESGEIQQAHRDSPRVRNMVFDTRELASWDTGLLVFLINLRNFCSRQNIGLNNEGLPEGAKKLLELASAVPEKKDAHKEELHVSFLAYLGDETVNFFQSAGDLLAFIGDASVAFLRLLLGKAQYRRTDLGLIMQAVGAQAVPIVSLISFLVGLILAFVGAIQLRLFGAQIYVADLVGIAMVRLMAAIMTGIVMAGRTGGAFAAQLGTMQVNQEIDALRTREFSFKEMIYRRFGYRHFRIKKRAGGYRHIYVPEPSILRVQRWIHQNILTRCMVHQCSTAYMPGCNTYLNAERHCDAGWLVKLDILRFFESISERQIYYVFKEMGYAPLLSFELARLTTRTAPFSKKYKWRRWQAREQGHYSIIEYDPRDKDRIGHIGHLPQGAPTSPILSNLVCRPLDTKFQNIAVQFSCTYTRYADDIAFSSYRLTREKAHELIKECSAILSSMGFTINRKKTNIIPPGAKKIVTGLLIDRKKPRLSREFKDNIRCHLDYAAKYGVKQHCEHRKFISLIGFYNYLDGLIKYAEHIEPDYGLQCRKQIEHIGEFIKTVI